ncbi:permease prefix domain 1-containing protein [Deinococcus aquaedulcis]|uniref:permease prefix domain 1-containing protein n=1 Tax=Deinococcus aquaedulcis TaxID=2840455 RepID=UPI001C831549|nr:permease prefix domain 1-containing protein [Deinococcus aquaedulcis]
MNGLERFLNRATRGLPAGRRRLVREELRGNILERTAELQVTGLPREEALRRALQDFGAPAPLAAGLRRVHLWPRLGLLGGLCSVALAGTLLALPRQTARELPLVTYLPECRPSSTTSAALCTHAQDFWVGLGGLTARLEAQGATVETVQRTVPVPAGLESPLTSVSEEVLVVRWMEATGEAGRVEFPRTNRVLDIMIEQANRNGRPDFWPGPVLERGGERLLSSDILLSSVWSTLNQPLTVERPFDGPVLRLGRLRLELAQPGEGVSVLPMVEQRLGATLYGPTQLTIFAGAHLIPRPHESRGSVPSFAQHIDVQGVPGEVYAVLRPVAFRGVNGLGMDLATVDDQGQLPFRSAQPQVRFVRDLKALGASGAAKPAVALLRLGLAVRMGRDGLVAYTLEVP